MLQRFLRRSAATRSPQSAADLPPPAPRRDVMISFGSSEPRQFRVQRLPGNILALDTAVTEHPPGTKTTVQWGLDACSGYAVGVVDESSDHTVTRIRLEDRSEGRERRRHPRVALSVSATVTTHTSSSLSVTTADVSTAGARVLLADSENTAPLATYGIAKGVNVHLDMALPGQRVRIRCILTAVDEETGTLRMRFIHSNSSTLNAMQQLTGDSGLPLSK